MLTNNKQEYLLTVLVVLLTICYLILLNYNIPFLAMDELAFVGKMQGGIESRLIYGRPSHVIGYGANMVIGFFTPDFIGLTKRLITMIILYISFAATLIHFKLPRAKSFIIASFAIMAHQVDWQHDGFVAFFGGYNLFLSSFLWALILNERSCKGFSINALSFMLIFFAFTSELFIVLSLIYIIAKAIQCKSYTPLYKGPIAYAAMLSVFLYIFLLMIYFDPSVQYGRVSSINYAIGSLSAFTPLEILGGSLIYFINSVPYFSSLNIPNFASIFLASILASGLGILVIKLISQNLGWGFSKYDFISNHNNLEALPSKAFLITLCALAFIPSLMIALQPMKLEWILSGSSRRYAFSLYEWLALVMVATIFVKYCLSAKHFMVSTGLVLLASLVLLNSILNNLRFANSYTDSLVKWRKIDNVISNSKNPIVRLPIEWLEHPYTLSLDTSSQGHKLVDIVKLIAINNYGKRVMFCYNSNDFQLAIGKYMGAIELFGFANQEYGGVWTTSVVPKIKFNRKFNKNDVIELTLVNAFAANSQMPIKYEIGSKSIKSTFLQNNKVLIQLNDSLENPTLFIHIPKSISPLELGLGSDSRRLGVMVGKLRVGTVQNGRLTFENEEQCI